MSKLETQLDRVFLKAREEALSPLVAEARDVLPDGWAIHMAVGWGFFLRDAKENMYQDGLPKRLPRGVRRLTLACAHFHDLFGPSNDTITNKGVRYP